jgi:ABC-type multidrug transport system fused ATPase/permease subunit
MLLLSKGLTMPKRFELGTHIAWGTSGLLLVLITEIYYLVKFYDRAAQHRLPPLLYLWKQMLGIVGGQAIISTMLIAASLCLPAHPESTYDGEVVDAQFSVSILNRCFFRWANPTFQLVANHCDFTVGILPMLDYYTRSANLYGRISVMMTGLSVPCLWKTLAHTHRASLIRVWSLAIITTVLNYGPFYCLYKTLTLLQEHEGKATQPPLTALFWAVSMSGCLLAQYLMQSRVEWTANSRLDIPIRAQLASMIYAKVLRMKDIKKDQPQQADGQEEIVNLITIDSARIADFFARCYIYASSLTMLVISTFVLTRLIGFTSLAAGLGVFVMLLPVNYKASTGYARAQVKVMRHRDERMSLVTEAVQGIRVIKSANLETFWRKKIMRARDQELAEQRTLFVWISTMRGLWLISPVLMCVVSLGTYVFLHGNLQPAEAFTAVTIFESLEIALSGIPFAVAQTIETVVSCRRVEAHLAKPEQALNATHYYDDAGIEFCNAAIAWPQGPDDSCSATDTNRFTLGHLDLQIPLGKLTVIAGPSGSGKSLLLAAMVGEADLIAGKISMPTEVSSIAWVSEGAWLENRTIQENIIFGHTMDEDRYKQVIAACALGPDLQTLAAGDLTQVGAHGVTLSGGQQWRVALARALYAPTPILVLDDIFSAVDAHVREYLLQQAIRGSLDVGRTIILATHHLELVRDHASCTILLSGDGRATCERGFSGSQPYLKPAAPVRLSRKIAQRMQPGSMSQEGSFDESEFRQRGSVLYKTYWQYLRFAGGLPTVVKAVVAAACLQGALLGRHWWLNVWTAQQESSSNRSAHYYLGVYALISVLSAALEVVKCLATYLPALKASRDLVAVMTKSILLAKLRWLDTNPAGRILHRYTADILVMDTVIPGDFHVFLAACFSFVAVCTAGITVSPYMAIPPVLLLVVAGYYQSWYVRTARETRRLENVLRSPVLSHCNSTARGISTIRAFGRASDFGQRMFTLLDRLSRASWSFSLVTQWMTVRMGLLGSFFLACVAVGVVPRGPALAGFALSFALRLPRNMETAIRRYANIEINMTSTERLLEYAAIEAEEDAATAALYAPAQPWPSHGAVVIQELHAGYAPSLPDTIRGLSLTIRGGERVAIVGRTGAGKSSLSMALMRFLDIRRGTITIDGVDISGVALASLRSNVTFIPQDPILFQGTIRSNIDPENQHSDAMLNRCMQQVHLMPTDDEGTCASSLGFGLTLDSGVSPSGSNLSQGQRQLVCLARGMISGSKIVITDEATSAVDTAIDTKLQRGLREHFRGTTVLAISHRLSTIADFDKVLVMEHGKAAEFGTPADLLANAGGPFWHLVRDSEDQEQILATISSLSPGVIV